MTITMLPPKLIRVINSSDHSGIYDYVSVRTKQTPPYVYPAPYRRVRIRSHDVTLVDRPGGPGQEILPDSGVGIGGTLSGDSLDALNEVYNRLRSKLSDELNDEAMLAVNYAERSQAADMMSNRLMQMARFAYHLRRRSFVGAVKSLGLDGRDPRVKTIQKGWRGKSKAFGDTFLEFHFGWEPLLKDIHATCELLSRPIRDKRVRVRSSQPVSHETYEDDLCENGTPSYSRTSLKGTVRGYLGCSIRVDNRNLYLANRLGLVNPAAVAWELVPFSFVVDWFVNVSGFINQHTDLLGVNVEGAYHGYVWRGSFSSSNRGHWFCNAGQPVFGTDFSKTGFIAERKLGIPNVTLKVNRPKRLSLTRAVTAISLLLQKL